MRANYEDLIGKMMMYIHTVITSRNENWKNRPETIDSFKYEEVADFEWGEDTIACTVKIGKTNHVLVRDMLTGDTLIQGKKLEAYINDMPFDKQIELFNAFNRQIIIPIMELGRP